MKPVGCWVQPDAINNNAKSPNHFSDSTGQIFYKPGYNDQPVMGIRIYTQERPDPKGYGG